MGSFSIWHWIIVLAVVLILFGGKGRIIHFFKDLAKGLKAFQKGLEDTPYKVENKKSSSKNSKSHNDRY